MFGGTKRASPRKRLWPDVALGGKRKRVADFLGAAGIILAASPVLLGIAVAIKLTSPGPVVFRQTRVGHGGREFSCLKFRSMVQDAPEKLAAYLASDPELSREWAETRKLRRDPRITSIGHFLRRSSLDELPQLFNVLRGEMSLVGPRPVQPDELDRYGMQRVHYLRTRPGMTGLWQVSGRSDAGYSRRIEFDTSYALHWSMRRDAEILLRTVPAVFLQRGAV
jgi:exopolysaccharide production protein ExoY